MSEKRFRATEYGSDYYIEIIDSEKELDESIHNPSQKLGLLECRDLLNKQQAIISRLEKENEQLHYQIIDLLNEQQARIKELEKVIDNEHE